MESLCSTPETNTVLKINYISIKIINFKKLTKGYKTLCHKYFSPQSFHRFNPILMSSEFNNIYQNIYKYQYPKTEKLKSNTGIILA